MQEEGPEVRLREGIDVGQLQSGETFEIADEVLDQGTSDKFYNPYNLLPYVYHLLDSQVFLEALFQAQ